MKKFIKIIGIFFVIIVILITVLVVKVIIDQRSYAEDQQRMPKTEEELIGERFEVPRSGKDSVSVNLYIPESETKTPVIFNIHGGAFIGGHADTLDTQSDRISKSWNAAVVTVNYKLAKDGISIEYGTEEIMDTVKYFMDHADEYNLDPNKFVVMGYSAGGYHALMTSLVLKKEGIDLAAQVLCYPYIKDAADVYATLSEEQQTTIAPALFVLAGSDPLGDGSLPYEELLKSGGIQTAVKKYENTTHGFLEENNPEYEKLNNKPSKSPEQEEKARKAENDIYAWLKELLK